MHPARIEPAPGQESVWDYPRPPRLEPVASPVSIRFAGMTIAETHRAFRVLETSHPPTYYLPPDDIAPGVLQTPTRSSICEWKGAAEALDVVAGGRRAVRAAWRYPSPTPAFRAMANYVAFYAGPMDACFVGDEQVTPQPGAFYGGWITSGIVGPFKGPPGTMGW
jgi:uncharacterized protein (DUF427 family)